MNKIKKTTFADRIRNAWRAFCGKPAGSISFGLEIKKCAECERRKQSEAIEEYRKKVYSKMEKYTVFGREYIQRIMREVEKEMKGGAE